MPYRVLYKKLLPSTQQTAIVEADFLGAADFTVSDVGALVLFNPEGRSLKAIPPGLWFDCEEIGADEANTGSPLITP